MIIYTDKFGFESDDMEGVTEELSQVLEIEPDLRWNDSLGGEISVFGEYDQPGGDLTLYFNFFHDGIEPELQENAYPEMELILLVEQEDSYVDYEPKLNKMKKFKAVLMQRRRYEDSVGKEVLFDLAKKRARKKEGGQEET